VATRNALSDEEFEQLRGFPEINRAELIWCFTLTPADAMFVRKFRGQGSGQRAGRFFSVDGGGGQACGGELPVASRGESARRSPRDGGPLAGKLLRKSDGPVLLSRWGVGRVGEGSDGAQTSEVSGLVVRLAGEHGIHDLAWSGGMIEADGVSELVEKSLVQEGPRGLLGEDDRGPIDKAVCVPLF